MDKSNSKSKSKSKRKMKRKSNLRSSESVFCRIQCVRSSHTQDIPFGHVIANLQKKRFPYWHHFEIIREKLSHIKKILSKKRKTFDKKNETVLILRGKASHETSTKQYCCYGQNWIIIGQFFRYLQYLRFNIGCLIDSFLGKNVF